MKRTDKEIRERSAAFYGRGKAEHIAVHDRDRNIPDLLGKMIDKQEFSLLDIGCGRGLVTSMAKDKYPDADIQGCDLAEVAVDNARELRPDITYTRSDDMLGTFDDNQFDYATCRMSIHHYPDIAAHLRAVHRILKPGGRYLIMDIVPPNEWADDLNRLFLTVEKRHKGDGHVKYYTLDEYNAVFTEAGFVLGDTVTSDFDIHWSRTRGYCAVAADVLMEMSQEFRDWLQFRDEGEMYHYIMPTGNLIAEAV